MLTQVAGRAARGPRGGRVVVQTYAPDHYAITAAAAHDYQTFFDAEMAARSVLAGVANAIPKSGGGKVEMIRMLKKTKDSAVKARTRPSTR